MDRVSVNIISPNLTEKGRQAKIYVYISMGLILLCYPINLLTGEGELYVSISSILLLNMFISLGYFHYVEKYLAIGKIIFDRDQLNIIEKTGNCNFKIMDITKLNISYHGYEDENYLSYANPYIRSSTGHDNVLSFQLNGKTFIFKFAIPNKTVKTFLNRQLDKYKKIGADIKLVEEKEFIEPYH